MANCKSTQKTSKYSFVRFISTVIFQLEQNGQYRTCQHYRSTLNSFLRFRGGRDVSLRKMDAVLMASYEAYLKQVNVCRNTSSFYMRILRAVYNRAVEQRLIPQQHPFRHVYTGIDKTRKRAISFDVVRRIRQLNLVESSALAQDAFMMSFYLRGISFIDLAHLRKSDIRNGYLHYNRSKTRQHMTVKWEPQMQAMVDKYKHLTTDSPYLFPFLHCLSAKENLPNTQAQNHHRCYHNAESRITYHLRKIGRQIGIHGNLTLYVARHSWATIARYRHQPLSVISEALGHDSELTTQIYLRSIHTSVVDQLNAQLLAELL